VNFLTLQYVETDREHELIPKFCDILGFAIGNWVGNILRVQLGTWRKDLLHAF
jgi:hypothetical protein